PTATAIYHHAQPPRSLDVCSTAARGSRLRACAAVRCSCWWTASATPRRRRWPLTSASAIPSCISVRPLGSATCSTTTASRRRGDSERLDHAARTALRLCAVAQNDGDELLRLMILAVLAKADRPLDAEELAERVAAMPGLPPLAPVRCHCPSSSSATPPCWDEPPTKPRRLASHAA